MNKHALSKYYEKYRDDGYIILKDIVNADRIHELTRICHMILKKHGVVQKDISKVHQSRSDVVNSYFPRSHHNKELMETVREINDDELKEILGFLSVGNLTVPENGTVISWMPESVKNEFCGFHQDGPEDSIEFGDHHIWIPITEERKYNFRVLPGTHLNGNYPHSIFAQFIRIPEQILKQINGNELALTIGCGDVLIFSTRLIHSLKLNYTDTVCWSLEYTCKNR
ncbi:MAG: phytanoyl-CoA dioxygenase family protein [Endozoicomonas sp.]